MPPKASPFPAKAKALGTTSEKTGNSAKDSADETGLPARKENKPPVEKKEVSGAKKTRTGYEGTRTKGGAQDSAVAAYDALDYVAPLPPGTERPASTRNLLLDEEDSRPGKKISMKLVATRSLGDQGVAGMTADEIADAVMKLDKVYLDDECIEEIDNLEALGAVTHLHLQRNRLQQICNLESLQHLQLLSLASNDIMDLRNLTCLGTLKALDVGYNLLDEVPAHELPKSLMYLTTEGNPLRKMDTPGAWNEVYALPRLLQHDCRDVPDDDDEDDGEEEEEKEASLPQQATLNGAGVDDEDASMELGSEGVRGEELLKLVAELGQRRLEAAAKVFEDSMALLRDNRSRVVETQRRALARDREQQDVLYKKTLAELEEMKGREEALAQFQKLSMAAKWRELAEQEAAGGAGGKGAAGSDAPAAASQRVSALSPSVQGGRGDDGVSEMPMLSRGGGDSGAAAPSGSSAGGVQGEGAGAGVRVGKGESVLEEFVKGLRPE